MSGKVFWRGVALERYAPLGGACYAGSVKSSYAVKGRRGSALGVFLLSVVFVLAGCGTSTKAHPHPHATSTRPGSTTTSTTKKPAGGSGNKSSLGLTAGEQRLADRVNMSVSDFPSGWSPQSASSSSLFSLPNCPEVSRIPVSPAVFSRSFGRSNAGTPTVSGSTPGVVAASGVMFTRNVSQALALVSALGSPSTLACINHSMHTGASGKAPATVSGVTVDVPGIHTIAFRLTSGSALLHFSLELVFFAKGNMVVGAMFGASGEVFSPSLELVLLERLAARA